MEINKNCGICGRFIGRKEHICAKINSFYGKHHTKETKEILRKKFMGRKVSDETRKKIIEKLNTEEIKKKMRKPHNITEKLLKSFIDRSIKYRGKNAPMYNKHHTDLTKQKLRLSHLGKKNSKLSETRKKLFKEGKLIHPRGMFGKIVNDETRKKISNKLAKTRLGKENPNWNGGTARRGYDYNFNRNFKRFIRQRDNQICMNCGIHKEKLKRALDVHHVDYNKENTLKENCISLCSVCHLFTQNNREYWIKLFQNKLSELYGYKYSEMGEIILEIKNGKIKS